MTDTNKERARPKIDANDLEAMAKARPDECFLKGSGVLKLIGAIRTLEREARAAKAPAAEPVAWRYQTPTGWHATTDARAAMRVSSHHLVEPLYTAPPAPTEQQIGALQAELAGNEAATMHLSRMVDELRALLCQAMRVMKDLHESATPDESREDCPPIIPTSDFAKFVNDNAALMYAIKQCGHDAAPPQGAAKGAT